MPKRFEQNAGPIAAPAAGGRTRPPCPLRGAGARQHPGRRARKAMCDDPGGEHVARPQARDRLRDAPRRQGRGCGHRRARPQQEGRCARRWRGGSTSNSPPICASAATRPSTRRHASTRSCAPKESAAIPKTARRRQRRAKGMTMTDEKQPRRPHHDRPKKRDIDGWIVLDKGVGMTSTHAVAAVKRALSRQEGGPCRHPRPARLGHPADRAGRGDQDGPLRDGRAQILRSSRSPGAPRRTPTTPKAGRRGTGPRSREPRAVEALLPRFTGADRAGAAALLRHQDPGRARLRSRPRRRDRRARGPHGRDRPADLVAHEDDRSVLEADCGKGTYVRAIARDLGRALGCLGHVAALRRTRVGPFTERDAVGRRASVAADPAALAARRGRAWRTCPRSPSAATWRRA